MKSYPTPRTATVAALVITLLAGSPAVLFTQAESAGTPQKTAVSGRFDWTLVPPNLPAYLVPGTDQDVYLRNMPLVGTFSLAGKGISLDPAATKISIQLNLELDPFTFSGPLWCPVVVTAKIDGVKTILFEGSATGNTVGLVSVGKATLKGQGPFEGTKLEFTFEEIGPGNSDTYTFQGTWMPSPK